MNVRKGLVIAEPWIGHILEGRKTWEMRSRPTSFRGWLGLIRKGSGAIWGVARLVDCGVAMTEAEMIASEDRHCIPEWMIRTGEVAAWNTPWKLADVKVLPRPVPYRHPSGAVIWVDLAPDVSAAIAQQLALPDVPAGWHRPRVEAPAPAPVKKAAVPAARLAPARQSAVAGSFVGRTELTEGNIRNNHIYLRNFFHHFPDDAIGGSNKAEGARRQITVEWGGANPVETDLDGEKKFFRSRAIARRFFEDTGAKAGDAVLVTETALYHYALSLQRGG